jgi:hypothetical protein
MTDDETRPEVVQALFDALLEMDPAKLAPLYDTGITPTERRQAQDLFIAARIASMDHRERWLEAFSVLTAARSKDHPLTDATAWGELFDELTPERVARLRELYDDLPDGAREEFDRRYGRPGES